MRCPFVRAVAEGDYHRATQLATTGPDPAEPAVVPVLLKWAHRTIDGATIEEVLAP